MEAQLVVHDINGKRELHPELDFDPRTNLFAGTDEDTFHVPEPGKPRRKRSALAVVAEMVVGVLYGVRQEP